MAKVLAAEDAVKLINSHSTLMVGGFLGVGTPDKLLSSLATSNVSELTVIANDTAFPDKGVGRLISGKKIKKAIVSHIGPNPVTGQQFQNNEIELELVPQGTLAERIRSGGAGLGGVLTPTGVGTVVAEGKQVLEIAGRQYLLETPLQADVALIKAAVADTKGNLVCLRTARNFNPVMSTAAEIVIAETDQLVPAGAIEPDSVTIPGIFVNYVVVV